MLRIAHCLALPYRQHHHNSSNNSNLLKSQRHLNRRQGLKQITSSAIFVLRQRKNQLLLHVVTFTAGRAFTHGWTSRGTWWFALFASLASLKSLSSQYIPEKIMKIQGKLDKSNWHQLIVKLIFICRKKQQESSIPNRPQGSRSEPQPNR